MSIAIIPALPIPLTTPRFEWVDPSGIVHDLTRATSPNMFVSKGTTGLGLAPVELELEKIPFAAGSTLRYIRTGPVQIDLPIYVTGSTMGDLMLKIANLRAWFDTGDEKQRTSGHLRITRPQDSAVRQLECYYKDGLVGNLKDGTPTWTTLVITLIAPDPLWTDIAYSSVSYTQTDITNPTLSVLNPGDVEAYALWNIIGPASNIQTHNNTTNEGFSLTANGGVTLSGADTLFIDSRPAGLRPGARQIQDQNGVSYSNRLAVGSKIWNLAKGSNVFSISASGTDANTRFNLYYLPRYKGVMR